MTFKPAVQKVLLRTSSTPRIERLCSVTGTLPSEVRVAFEKRNQTVAAEAEGTATEKLMPCGMRYPEPFRARPNFFIPILAVSSYVAPFFMLLFVSANVHKVPVLTELMQFLYRNVEQIYVPEGVPFSLLILFVLTLPMLVGGLAAYALSRNRKFSFKQKLMIWFVPVLLLVTLEIFSGGFITTKEPYQARGIDSAHY